MTSFDWVLRLLVCPRCRGRLELSAEAGGEDGYLDHRSGACAERYPVIDGVPRLLLGEHRGRLVEEHGPWFAANAERRALGERWRATPTAARRDAVVRAFDYEWGRYSSVGTAELLAVARQYFDQVPESCFSSDRVVLDAGCGAGRWAYETAIRGPRVIAMDLGLSVEVAKRNTVATGRVACIQADLRDLPLSNGAVDWAYSLGVLHHLVDPQDTLATLVKAVREGGAVLIYLYYALDNRGAMYRLLYRASDLVRRLMSRLPRALTHAFASLVAVGVYLPLARSAALAHRLGLEGLSRSLPLSFYRDLSLEIMRNDSLDRFGTRLEKRYTRSQVIAMMEAGGLRSVRVSPDAPFWHAIGTVASGHQRLQAG